MQTNQTLYQNEKRAVEIRLTDQNDESFVPDAAYTTIYDSDGNVVRELQNCYQDGNSIYDIVGPTVTENVGNYEIIWKVESGDYIYYHKTNLTVLSL